MEPTILLIALVAFVGGCVVGYLYGTKVVTRALSLAEEVEAKLKKKLGQ